MQYWCILLCTYTIKSIVYMHTVHNVVQTYCIEYILLLRYNFLFNKQPKLVNSVRNRWSLHQVLHHYCHRRMHHRMVKVTVMTWMMALMDPNNLWNLQTKLYRSSSIIARYPLVQSIANSSTNVGVALNS